jgi:hypothetical protein
MAVFSLLGASYRTARTQRAILHCTNADDARPKKPALQKRARRQHDGCPFRPNGNPAHSVSEAACISLQQPSVTTRFECGDRENAQTMRVRLEPHRIARTGSLLLFSLAPLNPLSRLGAPPQIKRPWPDNDSTSAAFRQNKKPRRSFAGVLSGPDCHDETNPRGCALSLSCRSAWPMTFLPQWKSFELLPNVL